MNSGGSRTPDSRAIREYGRREERKERARHARRKADAEAAATPDSSREDAAVATLEAAGFGVHDDGAVWTIIDTSGDRVFAWARGIDELEAIAERVAKEDAESADGLGRDYGIQEEQP